MNSFDIDGVVSIGIYPGPYDIIITGRSYEEANETTKFLKDRGIFNEVHFNRAKFSEKSRAGSAYHKVEVINDLGIETHFEDDPIQADIIEQNTNAYVVRVLSDLVNLENVRRNEKGEEL